MADAAPRKLFCNTDHSNTAHHSYHNQISLINLLGINKTIITDNVKKKGVPVIYITWLEEAVSSHISSRTIS